MGEVVNAIAQSVTFDLLVDRKRTMLGIVVELHLRSVETSLTLDEVTDSGVFDDHLGPERIARETEKESTMISGDFDNNIGPASDNMLGVENLIIG